MAPSAEWPITDIRDTFFSYFKSNDHLFIPSSPLIPIDGPTAPIIHAALSQFKQTLEGTKLLDSEPPTCFSLKCIRASGDALEHFRMDTSYHSLTELLVCCWPYDNFEMTIASSLELLTTRYMLPVDKIQWSYFGGDNQLSGDDESANFLKKYLPAERIVSVMGKDNFWSAGDTGPCGPSIAIRIDSSGLGDSNSFVEVLRLVFVQFDRQSDGALHPLKAKPVITAMNVESLASILQRKASHYKLDIFTTILEAIEYHVDDHLPWYGDQVGPADKDGVDMAYRLVADHMRTIAATTPYHPQLGGTEGREYFLKRLDIQAVQFGYEVLKLTKDHYKLLVREACDHYARTVLKAEGYEVKMDAEVRVYEKTQAEMKELQTQLDKPTGKKENVQQEHSSPVVWYETRMIECLGHYTHIILKDKRRQCSLVALCNALLLGGKIVLELGSANKVSEGYLLHLVQRCLLYCNSQMRLEDNLEPSHSQNQVLGVLSQLRGSLYFDITFDSIDGFKMAPEVALFKYLEVPIYHGWLVEPQDMELASAMRKCSYVQHLTTVATHESFEKYIESFAEKPNKSMESTGQKTKAKKSLERISEFFQGPQLTQHGFSSLRKYLENNKPCVFIWNEHLINIIKFEDKIYKLVNETSLPTATSVVWERIIEVNHGGEFVNGSFASTDAGAIQSTLPLTKEEKMRKKKEERKKRREMGLESNIPPTDTKDILQAETSVSISHKGDEQDEEQGGKLDKPSVAEENSPSSWSSFRNMMIPLGQFVLQPGNNFAETKTIFSRGTSLMVADTTRTGRVIGYGILKEMLKGHSRGICWNGSFDLTNIYVVDNAYVIILAPVWHERNDDAMLQDRLQYLSKIIELFRTVKGLPAFFKHLTRILGARVAPDPLDDIWVLSSCTLALKSSMCRTAFFSGIHRIRCSAPHHVSTKLRALLNSEVLPGHWREVITCTTGHPLLKMVLRRVGHAKKKASTGGDEAVQIYDENGLYKDDTNSLSIFARHVNEHGTPTDEDLAKEEEEGGEPFNEPFDSLSELDLLYCHYLQDFLPSVLTVLLCSSMSEELWRWLKEVLEEYDRPESLWTTISFS